MKSFAVLVILCAVCCSVKTSAICDKEDTTQYKKLLMGNIAKVNFFEAYQICRAMDMRLATVSSQEDNIAITELIRKSKPKSGTIVDSYWTSGTDLANEGRFIWLSTGQPIVFTNWSNHQPDNADHGDGVHENCLEYWSTDNGVNYNWNDQLCSDKNYFICESEFELSVRLPAVV